ncbi:hypothetical protein HDV04_002102 [Boothiomyces sp. JEL0838]|nr:hypothetical protein HDV04_002102 [Boothiomyces sp. JEL0838]
MESAFNSLDKSAGECKQFAVINYSNADDIASVSGSSLSKKKQLIGDLEMEMYRRIQNLENVHDCESWESVLQRIEEKRNVCFQNVDAEKTTDESKMTDDSFQYSYSGNILDEMTNEQSKVNQNISPSLKEESMNNVEEDLEHCRKVKKVKLTTNSPGFVNEDKENISGSFQFRSLKSEDMFSSTSSEGKLCVLKLSQDNTIDGMTTEEELILSLPKSSATISQIGENTAEISPKTSLE